MFLSITEKNVEKMSKKCFITKVVWLQSESGGKFKAKFPRNRMKHMMNYC